MNIQAKTFDEYFSQTEEREPELRQLDTFIVKNAPHLKKVLFKNMGNGVAIGYGLMPYQSSAMKEPGEWPLLALANQKNYMALYICAIIDGQYVAEKHKNELGKVNIGRSCIRFKKAADLNLEALEKIITDLDKRYANGEKLYV